MDSKRTPSTHCHQHWYSLSHDRREISSSDNRQKSPSHCCHQDTVIALPKQQQQCKEKRQSPPRDIMATAVPIRGKSSKSGVSSGLGTTPIRSIISKKGSSGQNVVHGEKVKLFGTSS